MAQTAAVSPRTVHKRGVLAVFDLDGTITSGDTLLPFLRFVAGRWRTLLGLLRVLPWLAGFAAGRVSRDRAKEGLLRAFLGGMSMLELQARGEAFARERLPGMTRRQAMQRLAWHKARGHHCVLLSASPALYVDPWARAVGFDEVLATELELDAQGRFTGRLAGANCRGEEKLRRLEARYGELSEQTVYGYGDSPADRHFLEHCSEPHYKPFTEGAAGKAPAHNHPGDLLRLMRPHQWVKNAFVFVGLIFGHAWSDAALAAAALLAAAAFAAVSSAIYIVNDFADRERDRLHPKKRHRPLASGRVTAPAAFALAATLATAGLAMALAAGPIVLIVIACYAAMNLAYSFGLKSVVILDVFVISAGFLLRILAGTVGIGVPPSQWLLVCTLLLTLFLGFVKRRSELLSLSGDFVIHRKALLQYNAPLLDKLISICGAGAILSYSLYAMSPDTARLHGTTELVYTIPFVAYGMFRYLYLLHAKQGGTDASSDVLRDPHLLATVASWAALSFLLISGAI
jgi:HAD superfamily hydrolase (TIGR01490 family)